MSLNESLDRVLTRYKELESLMSEGGAGGDKIAKLGKEYSDLGPVVEAVKTYRKAQADAQGMADLLADPATAAILDKHLPGIADHPARPQFEGMTLAEVMPYSEGAITQDIIDAIDADIKALGH